MDMNDLHRRSWDKRNDQSRWPIPLAKDKESNSAGVSRVWMHWMDSTGLHPGLMVS